MPRTTPTMRSLHTQDYRRHLNSVRVLPTILQLHLSLSGICFSLRRSSSTRNYPSTSYGSTTAQSSTSSIRTQIAITRCLCARNVRRTSDWPFPKAGLSFTAATPHGIELQFSSTESQNSIGTGEVYHAPLPRIYRISRQKSSSLHP